MAASVTSDSLLIIVNGVPGTSKMILTRKLTWNLNMPFLKIIWEHMTNLERF